MSTGPGGGGGESMDDRVTNSTISRACNAFAAAQTVSGLDGDIDATSIPPRSAGSSLVNARALASKSTSDSSAAV